MPKDEFNLDSKQFNTIPALKDLEAYGKGYKDGYRDGLAKRGGQFTEDNMLTNSELGGNLTLIYDYNLKKRNIEADFSEKLRESLQRLDADYKGKSGKVAGDELEKLIQAKLKTNQNMNYMEAFGEVQLENPKLTSEYILEIKG